MRLAVVGAFLRAACSFELRAGVGPIDASGEIRVHSTVRSAGWILTEYGNQSAPATFYAVGLAMNLDQRSVGLGGP